jgi:hypothetical protein
MVHLAVREGCVHRVDGLTWHKGVPLPSGLLDDGHRRRIIRRRRRVVVRRRSDHHGRHCNYIAILFGRDDRVPEQWLVAREESAGNSYLEERYGPTW